MKGFLCIMLNIHVLCQCFWIYVLEDLLYLNAFNPSSPVLFQVYGQEYELQE